MPLTVVKRDAPASAVTVSPTVVPTYAKYCSSASACKLKKDLCHLHSRPLPCSICFNFFPDWGILPTSILNPNPPKTNSNRNLLTLCSADYSACSCAGVTGVTTFAPTPTVTVTESTTVTCALERKVKRGLEVAGGIMNFGRM